MAHPSPDRMLDPGRAFRIDWEVREATHCEALSPPGATLSLDLRWERRDPLAVTLSFPRVGNGPVGWVMARSLLTEGLTRAVGSGDIRVRPLGAEWVVLGLRSPRGEALLAIPRRSIDNFLDVVGEQVPPDIDTMIDVEIRGVLTTAEHE